MNKKTKITAIIVGVLAVGSLAMMWAGSRAPKSQYDMLALAQCLAGKKVTMYGAEWCSHCQEQKALFGDAFKFVPYVECPDNVQQCIVLGIEAYPTWIFPNGDRAVGELTIDVLAQKAGCPLLPAR